LMLTNLTTGYHRDLQLLKEAVFPSLTTLKSCLEMSTFMLESIEIRKNILNDSFYQHLFSVESVNELVLKGVPFRDAYKKIGAKIESNDFSPNQEKVEHTHEGSIGNLCLEEIQFKLTQAEADFDFSKMDQAFENLLKIN
jgi:argininosuccinate lyase